MNKKELTQAAATAAGLEPKAVEPVLDALLEAIGAALADGQDVVISGFGTFEVRERAARKGRNPQTGAEIDIAASKAPAFKAAAALKRTVA